MKHPFFFMGIDEAEFKKILKEVLVEVLREAKENEEKIAPEILNVAEAATFLKLQISTLYEKTAARLIPHFKKGNRLYFYRAELQAWLGEGKVKTQQELQGEAATFGMHKHHRISKIY